MPENQNPISPNFTPGVGRLTTDRYDFQSHVNGTAFRHNADQINLSPSITIQSTTYTDVQDVIARLAVLVGSIPAVPNATTSVPGLVQLSGDIAGTYTSVTVTGLQTKPVSIASPTPGQALAWNGSVWTPTTITFSGAAGGDLSGSYPNPTVSKINGSIILGTPTSGTVLIGGGSSATWTAPTATLVGDVTGSGSTSGITTTVAKIQGVSISGTPSAGQTLVASSSTAASWTSPARAWVTNAGAVSAPSSFTLVLTTTLTPTVSGKIRVSVTGFTSNNSSSTSVLFSVYINAFGGNTADFTQFLGVSQGSGVSNPVNIVPVSYAYDYDKLSSPHIFTIGTPVTFNVFLNNFSASTVGLAINALQLEVQETR
jgi:hypothetical protein